jgi:hypothetical protein
MNEEVIAHLGDYFITLHLMYSKLRKTKKSNFGAILFQIFLPTTP